jgi:ABC-2 type transport system ATP-binding protein
MIEVENLTKDYGSRRAVDSLTFDAKQGEILGFLGPNGAGKTTTMRILAGYMPPTSGVAKVAGYDVVEESLEARRRVGYMPESVPLYPDLTVYEYLKYMGDLRGVENIEEQVLKLIDVIQLGDRADSYIEKLSKGMRQRVGIAQALLHEPEVLILDEPTIGLDPAQIREVRELIVKIGKERTVMLSTHILAEAQQICDRVLIINKGVIVAEDSPEKLEERLSGAQRVAVRISGDADKLAKKLDKIKGVTSVMVLGEGKLEFLTKSGEEVRPEVARAVIKEKLDLLELRPIGMSLEDIFLEITGEGWIPGAIDKTVSSEEEIGTEEEGSDA